MRRYGTWAGNPKGTPEDLALCVVSVWPSDSRMIAYQCCRRRGHGPGGEYCGLHAKMLAAGRKLNVPEVEP